MIKVTVIPSGPCLTLEQRQQIEDCAERQAADCNPKFCNDEVTETAECPDGSIYSYTLPAGEICAGSQQEANVAAFSMAKQRALERIICTDGGDGLGNNRFGCCLGVAFDGNILLPVDRSPYAWSFLGGPPTGVFDALTDYRNYHINYSGTPTVSGDFTEAYEVTAADGSKLTFYARFYVLDIVPHTLPAGTVSVGYLFAVTVPGVPDGSTFLIELVGGALPPGLTIDPEGVISGTPTLAGTYSFTLRATMST